MKRTYIALIALLAGLGLAGSAIAQGRHDEKPHNPTVGQSAASATASDTTKVEAPSGTGGRHDEKPHGKTKKTTTSNKADAKPAPTTAPAAEPKSTTP